MNYTYTILFADNVPEQVAPRIHLLEAYGYRVLPAVSLEDAQEIMAEEHVHLAILDLRMIDELDEKDVSGLSLAKDARFRSIPKIIYTGYPSLETMRAALKYPLMGMPDAVDYILKQDTEETLMTAIQTALNKIVHINTELEITNLKAVNSIASLVNNFESSLARSHMSARIDEMEDLFRALFYDYRQITISNVFWCIGERFALEALAYKDGSEEKFIVVGGKAETIMSEIKTYEKRVPKAHKTASLASFKTAEGVHYAIRAVPIPAGENFANEIKTLHEFCQNHSTNQIKEVIGNLFGDVLALWRQREPEVKEISVIGHYRQRLGLQSTHISQQQFLGMLYKLNRECMVRNIAEFILGPESWGVSIQKGPLFRMGNPLMPCYATGLSPSQVRLNLSSGYLSVETVLVNQNRYSMLTDYASVVQAPVWDDFVTLEHSVRVQNIRNDLQSLLTVEKSLLTSNRLDEYHSPDDVDGELKRVAGIIQMIRLEAARLKEFSLSEYLIALYFYTISDLLSFASESTLATPQLKKYAYQLALAGMISGKLSELSKSSSQAGADMLAGAELTILDAATHQVLVGERMVDLTPQEYTLFQYLFEHAGKVCTRPEILKDVYGLSKPSPSDDNMLTQNISRIRKKIEANPDLPVYLQKLQGVGYKLVTQPH